MPPGHRYEQFCPLARAAEVVGERWTLLVLRELGCGPQRFSDLLRRLPGLSSSVLSDRLARLEARGLVARRETPPPTPAVLYAFTEEGEALRPVLRELIRFGVRHLEAFRPGDHVEPDWMREAARAFARTGPTPARVVAVTVRSPERPDEPVSFRVSGGREGTRVQDGSGPAEVAIEASPLALIGLVAGRSDPASLAEAGELSVRGDADALRELPALFDLQDLMARPSTG